MPLPAAWKCRRVAFGKKGAVRRRGGPALRLLVAGRLSGSAGCTIQKGVSGNCVLLGLEVAGLAPPCGGSTVWFLSLGCAGRVARYLFHVRSRRADVSYGVVKGWFAGCRASLRCRQGAGASFFTAVVLRIAGFPALARNGLPDSFLF